MPYELLHDCLHPVMLGANTLCHACVRQMEKSYGAKSTVLTGKRALTLRFLPCVELINAPPLLADEILFSILSDVSDKDYGHIPLLILCDEAYGGFVARNKAALEARFIFRRAQALLGKENDRDSIFTF